MSETEETNTIVKNISFNSGEFKLKGTLHLPDNPHEPPVVIGSHGLLSTGASPKQAALAEKCTEMGMAYFRFDHRGCGESDGVFRDVTSLENRRKDLLNAISVVREMDDTGDRIGLFGSSFGGAAVLSVALESNADAVVTYAAPITGAKILQMLEKEEGGLDHPDVDPKMLDFDITGKIGGVTNILIVHGDSDKVVSPSEAHRIYQKAINPKRLIFLKNGDHPMGLPENREKFTREAASWFKAGFR